MVLLEILGGWFLLSCIAAPFIGRFIALNAHVPEPQPGLADPPLQAVRSY